MTETTTAAAPATTAAVTTQTTTAAPATQQSEYSWLGDGITDDDKGYVQNKGWKGPNDVYTGYRNLEKLLGADRAGNTVILPKEGAPPEEMAQFFTKLGRPETPDKYEIAIPAEHGDPEFAKAAAGKFHELGLTAKQGKELTNWWNEHVGGMSQAQVAAREAGYKAEVETLRKEQGAALSQNEAIVDKAAAKFGLGSKEIDGLKQALGPKKSFELLLEIGKGLGEHDFAGGGGPSGGKVSTPEQAKLEIQNLRKDAEFVKKYTSGDVEARRKMEDLHKMAYPDG